MRIAEVIGSLTLSSMHPTLKGYRWLIAAPFSLQGLRDGKADGEEFVVLDELGAGMGQKIAVSEGVEAQMPFYPNKKPLDGYCAIILDQVQLSNEGATS